MSQNIKKEMRTTLIETLKNVLHTLKDERSFNMTKDNVNNFGDFKFYFEKKLKNEFGERIGNILFKNVQLTFIYFEYLKELVLNEFRIKSKKVIDDFMKRIYDKNDNVYKEKWLVENFNKKSEYIDNENKLLDVKYNQEHKREYIDFVKKTDKINLEEISYENPVYNYKMENFVKNVYIDEFCKIERIVENLDINKILDDEIFEEILIAVVKKMESE